jgi:hypothetical protein
MVVTSRNHSRGDQARLSAEPHAHVFGQSDCGRVYQVRVDVRSR